MGGLAEVAVWWVALTAGYVTTLGAFTGPEFVVLSFSPGSVVLDWPPDGPLVPHELGSGPPHREHKVTHGSGPWS